MKGLLGGSLLGSLMLTAPAYAITVEDLQDTIIQNSSELRYANPPGEGAFDTQMVMVWKFKIDPEGRVSGGMSPDGHDPAGSAQQTARCAGGSTSPARPLWAARACGCWRNKLVLLRAFEAGGMKAEIENSSARRRT